MKAKPQKILTRSGQVLVEGTAPTLKAFVEGIVREGRSLAGADLANRDLAGLNLDGADFDGADLEDADLRGSSIRYGSFAGACFKGALCQGMNAERARFHNVILGRTEKGATRFDGARLAFSEFDGAQLDGAIFDDAGLSRASFAYSSGRRTSFKRARLRDTMFTAAKLINPDLSEADLRASTRLSPEQQPDRTAGAMVIQGHYAKAMMDETGTPAFQRDRRWARASHFSAWLVATTPVAFASHSLPHHVHLPHGAEAYAGAIGAGVITILASSALLAAKEGVAEKVRGFVEERISDAHSVVRKNFDEAWRNGVNFAHLTVAAVRGASLRSLKEGLAATRSRARDSGATGWFRGVLFGKGALLFADRRHLAMALEAISASRKRHKREADIVVIRQGESIDAPSIVRLRQDGGASMVWTARGKVLATADYDAGGDLVAKTGDLDLPDRQIATSNCFARALLADHGIALNLPADHDFRAGGDGSIITIRPGDRRIDNPLGAAIIGPDGAERHFRSGVEAVAAEVAEPELTLAPRF